MKENNKIVFFIETDSRLTGLQTTMLDVAAYLSNEPNNEIYFVNNLFEEDIKRVEGSKLNMCDIKEFDFNQYYDATFVVPVNYLFYLLARLDGDEILSARILLYFYDENSLKKLFNQAKVSCQKNSFLSIIKGSNAYCFADRKSFCAASNEYGCFYENYLPYTIPFDNRKFEPTGLVSNSEINIAYYGNINIKDINAINVIARNLVKYKLEQKVNFHIIGDPTQLLKNEFSKYAPYVRFVIAGELSSNVLEQYIKENVDVVIASNEFALKATSFNIPVVIPITSIKLQNDNRYVFIKDVVGYQYGWDRTGLLFSNSKMYNFYDVLKKIWYKNKKESISNACYKYYEKSINVGAISNLLLRVINDSTLTVKKIESAEFVLRQMSCYKKFVATNNDATYKDFLARYGKKNVKERVSIKQKIFNRISVLKQKHETNKKAQNFLRIQNGFNKKVKKLQQEFLLTKKIKVAFVVVFNSVFPTRPIFELMLQDATFDPYIVVAPNISRTYKYQMQLYNVAYDNLSREYPGRVINGYDKNQDTYLELKDEFSIIFFCNPYKHLVHPYHEIEYFIDKNVLTLYSSYGFAALKFWDEVISTDFYNYLWRACVETESNLEHLKNTQIVKGINGVVTGYIKVDKMASVIPEKREKKRVLICPHHTVWGWKTLNISNFLKYKDFFVELPKLFPEIEFVFRPHPLLFANLKAYKHWSQEDVNNYLSQLLENSNIIYDTSGEYFDKFVNSDAMIHDCGSFIGEYLYTEKPCCYMMKSEEETMNGLVPLGQQCMQQYYHAFSKEDIIDFIQNVVVNGDDPLKEQREAFVQKELKQNYPHAAETVIKMIKDELKIK